MDVQDANPVRIGDGITFLPLRRHPTGTLIGEFYKGDVLISRGPLLGQGADNAE
ncbi:hypothetical protein [Corynebacterium flavescens]|uniref:Uncharacterized protein n=1 Tax=Corynebacterium flavescens TaxID=28028 RepID=A0AB73B877_CORFL|nr:hypothetical protein [Corynebacterium flavescens]GEB97755.1 hypothetical protein CFL01nite_12500 [Corynebacterium flavescens]